ncbi:hypothetical protein NEOLEDRAFT_1135724 [Neolentinus lepideus HHB14362 ss-1]|uniref:Uncharacterized protein n=1 Tax=Neolentinus lepideus HHB14362 ss-1 TaxID=1314782 RepID=A0A165RJ94_9AGAM|nr:hypothetical protein NEOLEDRAFT_1135724 [Neolentinus lepideus HHB14362 ss-1]
MKAAAAGAALLLPAAFPSVGGAIVQGLGFGALGVVKASPAALYQSAVLGGYIAKGSAFAWLQSVGALGTLGSPLAPLLVIGVPACAYLLRSSNRK